MVVWALIGTWLAALFVITCRVARKPPTQAWPAAVAPCTLVRICGGPEPRLRHNLLSVSASTHAGLQRVILVVPHDDPQRPTVDAAADALRARGIATTVFATDVQGANHKVAQLAASQTLWATDHDIVCADGDVDLTAYPIDALRAPLQDPSVGAVWAPCAEASTPEPAPLLAHASAAVLSSSLHCFALLGRLDPGGMVGKLWAVRYTRLQSVGGWSHLIDTLGEDMELARRFCACNLRVVVAPTSAWSRPAPRSWRTTVARYARWFWVIRTQRPHLLVSYPLLFFGTSLVLALCAYQARLWPWQAGLAAACAVGLRVAQGGIARRAVGRDLRHILRDCWLGEVTILAAFVCMLLQRTVRWRHQRLHVRRGGRITLAKDAPC